MIDLDPQLVTLLAIASLALSVLLLLVVVVLALRLRRVRHVQQRAFAGGTAEDVVGALGRHDTELSTLRRDVATVHANTEHLRELLRTTVSRVGVVRYDAFDDMGGALSFSAALLDEAGTGMVVSAINGRTETRCYAKAIAEGRSEHSLSEEERAAVAAAIGGQGPAVPPPDRNRRRRRVS